MRQQMRVRKLRGIQDESSPRQIFWIAAPKAGPLYADRLDLSEMTTYCSVSILDRSARVPGL
jgi:hypothetical protein